MEELQKFFHSNQKSLKLGLRNKIEFKKRRDEKGIENLSMDIKEIDEFENKHFL